MVAWIPQEPRRRAPPATATLPDAVTPSPPANQPSPTDAPQQPDPPESTAPSRRWLGLDHLGVLQVLGGLALSLIALFSSYDHITAFGRTLQLQQQWGIVFIAASLATVIVDAELASGSRLRAAQDAARMADESARERYRADQERQRADRERDLAGRERNQASRERNRAAEARERQAETAASQRESLEDIRRAVFLSARVHLDATGRNRARLQAFLTLMDERPTREDQGA